MVEQNRDTPPVTDRPLWVLVSTARYPAHLSPVLRSALAQAGGRKAQGSYLGLYWDPGTFCSGSRLVLDIRAGPTTPKAGLDLATELASQEQLPSLLAPPCPVGSPVIQPLNTSILPALYTWPSAQYKSSYDVSASRMPSLHQERAEGHLFASTALKACSLPRRWCLLVPGSLKLGGWGLLSAPGIRPLGEGQRRKKTAPE